MLASFAFALVLGAVPQAEAPFRMPVLEGATPEEPCETPTEDDGQRYCLRVTTDNPREVSNRYMQWLRDAGFRIVQWPEADAGFINTALNDELAEEKGRASYLASGRDDVMGGSINAVNIADPASGEIYVVLVFETFSARRFVDQAEPRQME